MSPQACKTSFRALLKGRNEFLIPQSFILVSLGLYKSPPKIFKHNLTSPTLMQQKEPGFVGSQVAMCACLDKMTLTGNLWPQLLYPCRFNFPSAHGSNICCLLYIISKTFSFHQQFLQSPRPWQKCYNSYQNCFLKLKRCLQFHFLNSSTSKLCIISLQHL